MVEYEVKITGISAENMRSRLTQCGARLHKPMYTQKIATFHLPSSSDLTSGWLRVRDEDDCVTMSLKIFGGGKIHDQHEYCFVADDFVEALAFLRMIGAKGKSRQEKRRETWLLDDGEIVIDEWPFLEPYLEVEGPSENSVRALTARLGFDYAKTRVCSVAMLYREKYGVEENIVNNLTPLIVFEMENPFAK